MASEAGKKKTKKANNKKLTKKKNSNSKSEKIELKKVVKKGIYLPFDNTGKYEDIDMNALSHSLLQIYGKEEKDAEFGGLMVLNFADFSVLNDPKNDYQMIQFCTGEEQFESPSIGPKPEEIDENILGFGLGSIGYFLNIGDDEDKSFLVALYFNLF